MAFNYESRNLVIERMPESGLRTLHEYVNWDDGVVSVTVPKFTQTDFASIPDLFKWYVNNDDWRIIRPAIVHDWLYKTHQTAGGFISRSQADILFYSMLRKEGMSFFKARLMWLGVRAGGWAFWNNEAE